jgi:LacI family transcriptional regulator
MPNATINDVAELAGVSIKTVSRVVNREPNVRDSTRDKVNEAITQLNYRPNQSARDLASHRTRLIILVYDDPSAYHLPSAGYIIKMQEGALRACRSTHYGLLIHPCNYRKKDVDDELKALIQQVRPAGIVLAAPLSNMPKIIRTIKETDTPFVPLSPGKNSRDQFSVATNDREICAEMTRHLASLGHREIAFITGHPTHRAVANRFLGYKDGLGQSGLNFSEGLVTSGDNSLESGEVAAAKLLNRKQPPTAIFAANDDMAAGVIRVADQMGIKIPEQLSVAGCDDITLAQQVYPALTTIRQPLVRMAEHATIALIDKSRPKSSREGTEVIPGELHLRGSSGPAPKS